MQTMNRHSKDRDGHEVMETIDLGHIGQPSKGCPMSMQDKL